MMVETVVDVTSTNNTAQKTQDLSNTGWIGNILRTSITTWTSTMIVETVVDVISNKILLRLPKP